MHANSPANSAPASSPARVAPAGSPAPERLTPRHRHQAATATVASAKRTKAWNTGATSATVALTSTCWKPQNMQQASSREMARASMCVLRVEGIGALSKGAPALPVASVHPLATLRAHAHIGKVHTDAYTGPRYTLRLLKQVPALLFLSPHGPYDGGAVPLQL